MPGSADGLEKLYRGIPLLVDGPCIRVLDLLPGSSDRISVRLRAVNLSSSPAYEALSYTWGTSSARKDISINDSYRIPVTDNLWNALKSLR